jgi:diguanylate cyclase (GGDEF)-like protein/PAS domain S-box-containing protein
MYLSGAVLVALSLRFSPDANVNRAGILALAGLAAASSAVIFALRRHYTIDVSQAFTAVGSVLVAGTIVMAHGTFLSIVYGMLLVWVAQFSAVFYRFRAALGQLLWAACVQGLALSVLPAEQRLATWALTTGTGVVVLVSYRLIERTSARLRGVMEHSGGIVLVVDEDLDVKYAGGAIERLLAASPTEIAGKSLLRIVHPDDRTRVQGAVREVLSREAHPSSFEVRLSRSDGSFLFTEANVENAMHNSSLDGIVITLRDVSERRILENELLHQAFHDPLTNLPNRALFADRVEWVLSRRNNEECSLLFIDLDNFKEVNDVYGHEAGDAVLIAVGDRLRETLRPEDTAARLGGDEFAILLDGIWKPEEALAVGERVLAAVQAPLFLEDREVALGTSVGIAIASGPTTLGDLLREADVAMYIAKRDGKHRCHVFHHPASSGEGDALSPRSGGTYVST